MSKTKIAFGNRSSVKSKHRICTLYNTMNTVKNLKGAIRGKTFLCSQKFEVCVFISQ